MPKVIDAELKARGVCLVLEHCAEYLTTTAAALVVFRAGRCRQAVVAAVGRPGRGRRWHL